MGDSNFSRGFEEILDNTESEIGDAIHQAMDLMAGVLREEELQFGAEADHVRVVPELEEAFRDRPSIASLTHNGDLVVGGGQTTLELTLGH